MSKTISNSNEFFGDNKMDNVTQRMGDLQAHVEDKVANLRWWPGKNSPRRCHLS